MDKEEQIKNVIHNVVIRTELDEAILIKFNESEANERGSIFNLNGKCVLFISAGTKFQVRYL